MTIQPNKGNPTRPPIHILAVEDDEVDAEFLQRHVRARATQYTLTVIPSSLEALHYLQTLVRQPFAHFPHLILLDLNLPGMDGLTFLRKLRQDPKLRYSIVFILTTSDLPSDKQAAYQAGVAGYVLKQNVSAFMQWLDTYCTLVEFPPLSVSTR